MSGKKNTKNSKNIKKLITNIFLILFILLIISGIFSLYSSSIEEAKEISLSSLVIQINEGKIKKIAVEGNNLIVELKDGTNEKSNKEKETSFTQSLKNYGVNQEELKEIELEIKEPSGLTVLAVNVLPFLIPILFIGFFLWFMLKQAKKGQTQALSFGKSNARLTTPLGKNKTTFKDIAGIKEPKEIY